MSRAHDLYGTNDVDRLFPEGAPGTSTPWPRAGRLKSKQDYDKDRVTHALKNPDQFPLQDVDPRDLHATQPSLTRQGVSHYMTGSGKTFQAVSDAGNKDPVVYKREDGQNLILSGHHRAATALLQGRQFPAKVIEGPWGPAR